MAATWTQVWTPVHEPGGSTEEEENLRGWVSNTDEAEDVKEQLQVAECITFVGDRKGKGFGNGILHLQNPDGKLIHMPRVRFSDIKDNVVSADSVPFAIVSRYSLRCMYGKDKNQAAKRKNEELAEKAMKEDHPLPRKRKYRRLQGSKKKGCPAMIEMKEVIRFTDYDTNDDSGMSKRAISDHIRADLRNGDKFNFERRIYIRLPSKTDHQSVHTLGKLTGFMNPMHKTVSTKLVDLVGHGVTNLNEMKRHLRAHLHTVLFPDVEKRPSITDTAFYPSDNTIRQRMYAARMQLRIMAEAGEKETHDQFEKRFSTLVIHGFVSLSTSLGIQSGLFDALIKLKDEERTVKEIADTAGLKERYVKEWLGVMVSADIVDINPETEKYSLPPHRIPFFLSGSSVSNLAVTLTELPMYGAVYNKLLDCLKKDGPLGLPYSEYTDFHTVMSNHSSIWVLQHLVQDFIPSMPQIEERMKSGIRILDLGCGRGLASLVFAENYPNSTVVGLDFSEEAINYGKERAKEKGLTNVEFVCEDAACIPDDWNNTIDYIYTFDVIHDLAHADNVLLALNRILKPDGVFSMIDIDCKTKHSENSSNDYCSMLYSMSLFHCLPISLFFEGSVGLGTCWGREKATEFLKDAGFRVDSITKPLGSSQAHYMCSKKVK
eukprot:XP_011660939.1 PREDICTED: uncharacterized protein LOC763009 isoform X2 [Strongylocentrotus purpuratus]